LADSHGNVYQHRRVRYDEWVADGCRLLACFWCGANIEGWREVVIDHLDSDKSNNDPHNLVVTCNDCNLARGAMLPFIKRLAPTRTQTLCDWMLLYRARVCGPKAENDGRADRFEDSRFS